MDTPVHKAVASHVACTAHSSRMRGCLYGPGGRPVVTSIAAYPEPLQEVCFKLTCSAKCMRLFYVHSSVWTSSAVCVLRDAAAHTGEPTWNRKVRSRATQGFIKADPSRLLEGH